MRPFYIALIQRFRKSQKKNKDGNYVIHEINGLNEQNYFIFFTVIMRLKLISSQHVFLLINTGSITIL